MKLLQHLGFGLDLTECAATGSKQDLIYVSPKSGRSVSAAAGKKYRKKLLDLPAFFISQDTAVDVIVVGSSQAAAAGGRIYLQFPVIDLELPDLLPPADACH